MDAQKTAHLRGNSAGDKEGHVHSHGVATDMDGRLIVSLVLTLLFVVGEFIAGIFSHSLALVSDSGHNLSDALAVGFSLYALYLTKRKPDPDKTFGYYRAGILAAALNAGTLVLIAIFIFYEAIQRFLNPEPVAGGIVTLVALVALVLNTGIALALRAGSGDLNIKAAYIHMAGDAISSVGVILAGIIILLTGWTVVDPLVSILIGMFILWSSYGIIREAVNILMEGTPSQVNMGDLIEEMNSVPGVQSLHDVHVWTIGHDKLALSAHVVTGNCSVLRASEMFTELNEILETKYDIVHSTLQPECNECDPNAKYCSLHDGDHSGHDHRAHVPNEAGQEGHVHSEVGAHKMQETTSKPSIGGK